MYYVKTLVVLSVVLISNPNLWADNAIWCPGGRYEVTIKYGFDASNVTIRPSQDFKWQGTLKNPHIQFCPIVKYTTEAVTNIGENYMAHRVYEVARNTFKGASGGNWSWDWDEDKKPWVGKRISAWSERRESYNGLDEIDKVLDEEYPVFGEGSAFDWTKSKLLLVWPKIYSGKGKYMDVYYVDKADNTYYCDDRKCEKPIVSQVINSECNLLYDTLFGGMRAQDKGRWTIEAKNLNALLCGEMKKTIKFGGVLEVHKSRLLAKEISDKNFSRRFTGVKLCVVDSTKATVKYKDGAAYKYHAGPESDSRIEFWYDAIEQVLRYANIVITINNYEGDVPNPQLGQFTKKFDGTMRGRFTFSCEYHCEISYPTIGENE